MKNKVKMLLVSAVSLFAFSPFAAADLEKYLPSSETLALIKIENIEKLEEKSKQDALTSSLNKKLLNPFFFSMNEGEGEKERRNLFSMFFKTFRGEAVFGITTDIVCGTQGLIFIADCSKDFDEALFKKVCYPDAKFSSFSDSGITFTKIAEGCGNVYAIHNGKFFWSSDEKTIKAVLATMNGEKSKGMSSSKIFKKARERIGDADFWFYVSGETLAKKLYAVAAETDEKNAEEREGAFQGLMLSIQLTSFVKTFAPEAVDALWGKYTIDSKRGLTTETSLVWNENKGLVTLLTKSLKDGIEKTPLLPDSQNLSSVQYTNYSVGAMILQLRALLKTAWPFFAIADIQLESLKARENIDILATIAAFENGFFVYSTKSGSPQNTLFIQNVSDEKLVLDGLKKMGDSSGVFKVIENKKGKGEPVIYDIQGLEGSVKKAVGFTFLEGKLCVGEQEELARLVAFNKKKGKGANVWANENLKAGEALLPPGGCAISYLHIGKTLMGFQETLGKTAPVFSPEGVVEIGKVIRAIDEKDFDYSFISKTYLGEKEITTKSITIKNK